jgi:hypothetical protein
MEKSIKMEQDLSEEQLQEITGGCAECLADLHAAKVSQNNARGRINSSGETKNINKHNGAMTRIAQAKVFLKTAQTLMDGVAARHREPLPDLNFPLPDLNFPHPSPK